MSSVDTVVVALTENSWAFSSSHTLVSFCLGVDSEESDDDGSVSDDVEAVPSLSFPLALLLAGDGVGGLVSTRFVSVNISLDSSNDSFDG